MIVIDTNVFSNASFCKWLAKNNINAIISSISYTELAYHYLKKGKDIEYLDAFLQSMGIKIVGYDHKQAKIAAKLATKKWDFRKNIRDYMIVSIAIKEDAIFITNNIKDFAFLPKEKIFTPDGFMKEKRK